MNMRAYRRGWEVLAALTLCCGVGMGLRSIGPGVVVALVLISAPIGAALYAAVWLPVRHRRRRVGGVGVMAALCCVSVVGLVAHLGWVGVCWTGMLLFTAPRTVTMIGRWLGTDEVDPGPPGGVEDFTDAQLCAAWRDSYETMNRCVTVAQRAQVAARRQRYLDELDRRHPTEVACWLYGGARPGNDPGSYLNLAE